MEILGEIGEIAENAKNSDNTGVSAHISP